MAKGHPPTTQGPPVDPSDDELMKRVQNGCMVSFAQIVKRHQPRLARVATKILGSEAYAEDAVQLTFLRLFALVPAYVACGKLRWLLLKMVVNESCQMRRREARYVALVDGEALACSNSSQEATVVLARTLAVGFAWLSEEELLVVLLHDFEGLTFEEVAAETDVPAGTLRRRHAEAVAKLHAWWKGAAAAPAATPRPPDPVPRDSGASRGSCDAEEGHVPGIADLFDLLGARKFGGKS